MNLTFLHCGCIGDPLILDFHLFSLARQRPQQP
jgi:hypothetical protein